MIASEPLYEKYIVAKGRKGIVANVHYRRDLIKWAAADKDRKRTIWIACKRDFLYFVNVFAVGLEPRDNQLGFTDEKRFPFITWPYQDETLTRMADMLGRESMYMEKSRDMGASWMMLLLFLWRWLFYPYESFLLISRNEKQVYELGNPDALFSKLQFMLDLLPKWLQPSYTMKKLALINHDTNSVINGESTNKFAGTGGRRKAIGIDEFAKFEESANPVWQSVVSNTECRIFVSTHLDASTTFFRAKLLFKPHQRFFLHWTLHPRKRIGLYKTPEGKERSPWYDAKCLEFLDDTMIKQELDIDPAGSSAQFFNGAQLEILKTEFAREPVVRGELDFDANHVPRLFVERFNGALQLFFKLDKEGNPPPMNVKLGIDIGGGTGSTCSNSSIIGIDAATGDQILELTSNALMPDQLFDVAMALAKWLNNAYLIWDSAGVGGSGFTRRVMDVGWGNCYYRTDEGRINRKSSDKPGFNLGGIGGQMKKDLLGEYRRAVYRRECKIRSETIYKECGEYIHVQGSERIEHFAVKNADAASAGTGHGDAVIAHALAWWASRQIGQKQLQKPEPKVVQGSFVWRRQQYEKAQQLQEQW